LATYARAGNEPNRHVEAVRLLEEMERNSAIIPNDVSYQTVISICAKENAWDAASNVMKQLEQKRRDLVQTIEVDTVQRIHDDVRDDDRRVGAYIQGMGAFLTKFGKKRDVWYKLGKYTFDDGTCIDFGVQIHRNPSQNGLSLVFFDGESSKKLGFMLVRNTAISSKSATDAAPLLLSNLMGMFIDDAQRGRGLANLFMGIWLRLCIHSEALPRTEVINKPLLSLVLTRFGFFPNEGGVEVEVSPITNVKELPKTKWHPNFALYSPTVSKNLSGVYADRDLRIQKMVIVRDPPNPRGKVTTVKTTFEHPLTRVTILCREVAQNGVDGMDLNEKREQNKRLLEEQLSRILGKGLNITVAANVVRFALFGFSTDLPQLEAQSIA